MSKTKNYDELTYYVNNPLYQKKSFKKARKCTLCNKDLPDNRFFNHDECVKDEDTDELYLEASTELHAYGKNVL